MFNKVNNSFADFSDLCFGLIILTIIECPNATTLNCDLTCPLEKP